MWWKIYFFVIAGLTLIGLPLVLVEVSKFNFVDWVGMLLNAITILACYSIAFKKKTLDGQHWKILFWFCVVNAGLEIAASLDTSGSLRKTLSFILQGNAFTFNFGEILFQTILAAPAIYAMFLLSKKK